MRKTNPVIRLTEGKIFGHHAMASRQTAPGLWLLLAAVWSFSVNAAAPLDDEIENGRRIYQNGILPSGAPLTGTRLGGAVSGASGACITCHYRSGMGSVEGDLQVSPITGNYLFGTGEKAVATMDTRNGKAFNQKHDPYTDESLSLAIRTGVNNRGQSMSPAMPRYSLDDKQMKALTAYLRQLSSNWSPGVTADTIRFATVITPDVEPARRQALLTTLRSAIAQRNGATLPGRRYMGSPAEMVLRTGRKWELDVWELQGPQETWLWQLEANYNSKPVFALVSGTSSSSWKPIEEFCEKGQVPCWFPSVDMVSARGGFYSIYFSRGIALEADVLSRYLRDGQETRKVVQLFREEYAGRGAAKALTNALLDSGITVENRVVIGPAEEGLAQALAGIDEKDAVMFWLRQDDLAALNGIVPPHPRALFFSAGLAGNNYGTAIPATWKQQARMVYPYELPDKREANLTFFRAWMKQRRLALVDERLQAEAYFAVDFLADTVSEMLDNLYRDYLIERAEVMIVRREGSKAEGEARQLSVQGNQPLQMQREGTTIYPRLSLGPGQRFASKGGYVVHFEGERLVADSKWIIP